MDTNALAVIAPMATDNGEEVYVAKESWAEVHRLEPKAEPPARPSLREIRQQLRLSQATVARGAKMSQGDLSCLERRKDWLLSSLRRYATGLGGDLEVAVVIDGQRFVLAL